MFRTDRSGTADSPLPGDAFPLQRSELIRPQSIAVESMPLYVAYIMVTGACVLLIVCILLLAFNLVPPEYSTSMWGLGKHLSDEPPLPDKKIVPM
ncbi:unnamed protein product [Arctia plantaginis]|uniref:Uncharacterized protein n=1 Tax=Arctia plantaginis TaxID=874455 RepID=A0A8S0ZY54_ARCPL|nr:unnamed protein product [Arctia plantaginis]